MNFYLVITLNLCILIPALTGVLRFRKINRAFYPFLYCLWLGSLVEIMNCILAINGKSNAIVTNAWFLAESILLTWQFEKWKLFEKKKILFPIILAIFSITWISENFFFSSIKLFSSYFRIEYSFIITILSIISINRLIVTERRNLLKNSTFLFCITFAFYFTFQVLVEAFWLYGMNDQSFSNKVYDISTVTNFIANLLFTLAIIWIPTKQRFTLPSS